MRCSAGQFLSVGLVACLAGCGDGLVAEPDRPGAPAPSPTLDAVPTGPVSEQEALALARTWPMAGACADADRTVDTVKPEIVDGVVTSYLVRFQNGGFIIVAGTHAVVPVIGYSCRPNSLELAANPTANEFLRGVNQSIRDIVSDPEAERGQPHPLWTRAAISSDLRAAGDEVAPLLTTRWGQGNPYNAFTPRVDGAATQLGCGALALGQLLRYHEFPAHGTGSNTYTWQGQLLRSETARQHYDWANMADDLNAEVADVQRETTQRFLADVAFAIEMHFGVGESGSLVTEIIDALPAHFRYPNGGTRLPRSSYSDTDWTQIMKTELRERRPVFYEGSGNGNHFFLLDGYDENDYFHVNWGWAGSLDGYFHISDLRPGNFDFSQHNVAQIGIAPERRGQGEACGGYAGYRCAEGLACKHLVDTAGACQAESWCHPDTAAADCHGLDEPGTAGFWTCVDSACEWSAGGGTQTVEASGQVAKSQWVDYGPYDVPAGGSLTAVLATATGDADLYVKIGGLPGSSDYDCRPYLSGTQVETCTLNGPGPIYVAVKGYATSSTFAITITYSGAGGTAPPTPVCGNGVLEAGETCDGSSLACAGVDPTFLGGTIQCNARCTALDGASCDMAVCGDDAVQGAEACDGEELTCTELDPVYTVGDAFCRDDCTAYNTDACFSNICGNGILEKPEDCDGANEACVNIDPQRFGGGTAVCQGDCTWDYGACESLTCGNGVVDADEQCDTTAPTACSAIDSLYTGGLALCTSCQWDIEACEYCGNERVEGDEICDGDTIACAELDPSYAAGEATCAPTCNQWLVGACQSGGPQQVTVTESGNAVAGQWYHFGPFDASAGDFTAVLTMTADVDLYVRRGAQPTTSAYDCRPYNGGATTETCNLSGPGIFYVSVRGYAASASFSLSVSYWVGDAPPPEIEEFATSASVGAGQWRHYGPFAAGAGELEAVMSGTGDADLYVRKGSQPTSTSYDCRPYKSSSNESCTLAGPGAIYVSVNGWASSSAFDLVVRFPIAN